MLAPSTAHKGALAMPAARIKKGSRVRIVTNDRAIVGTIASVLTGWPYPYLVDVDLDDPASAWIDEDARAYYGDHFAGPYKRDELEIIG